MDMAVLSLEEQIAELRAEVIALRKDYVKTYKRARLWKALARQLLRARSLLRRTVGWESYSHDIAVHEALEAEVLSYLGLAKRGS